MAALPTVGSDTDAWGTELNTYLLVSLNADGTLKVSGAGGTLGSVPFIGAAGAISQDNANFFYDSTNHVLRGPIHAGGSATTSTLILRSTVGVGATGADIIFQVGNNGATEAIRILNAGHVGIGTPSPDMTGNAAVRKFAFSSSGLTDFTVGGNTSLTSAIIAAVGFTNSNLGVADKRVAGIFAATDGATNSGNLAFYTANAGTLSERMRIDSAGKVGIGGTPAHVLQLVASDDAAKTTTTTWTTTSDERAKRAIEPFTDGLAVLKKLEPVQFEYTGAADTIDGDRAISVVAQRHLNHAPYLFRQHRGLLHETDTEETDIWGFNPHALFFLSINAFKELDRRVAALEGARK